MSVKYYEGIRAVTVPGTTAPNSGPVITAPCRLCGWSLFGGNQASQEQQGSAVAPGAATTLCQIASVPAGEYTVNWTVGLSGPAAAAEQNNFRLRVGGVAVAISNNLPAAGEYPQQTQTIVVAAGGQSVQIQNIGAGTAGVTYDASFVLSAGPETQAQIMDSQQILGMSAMAAGATDTQWLSDDGVYVSANLAVLVNAGTISGVLYVRDYRDVPKDREYSGG